MVDAPASRRPAFLWHEQRRHQRLEHAATPRWRNESAVVGVGALENLDAVIRAVHPDRPGLLPTPVTGIGERTPGAVVLLGWKLPFGDPNVTRDAALADDSVIAARRRTGAWRVIEGDSIDVRPVVEPEVHAVVQTASSLRQLRHAALNEPQASGQPAVVDRREDRGQRRAGRRPRGQLLARTVVVPVVELAGAPVALHPLECPDRG